MPAQLGDRRGQIGLLQPPLPGRRVERGQQLVQRRVGGLGIGAATGPRQLPARLSLAALRRRRRCARTSGAPAAPPQRAARQRPGGQGCRPRRSRAAARR
ncbi:MAG: hypothetical protein LW722_06405, partial [Rubrivivax sp.]|nr:hypothetical protein [Rubrivivax sp.]